MADDKDKKKVVTVFDDNEYMAKWGPKGFLVTPKKVVPFLDLHTSFSMKDSRTDEDGTVLAAKDAQKISFRTIYAYTLGTDPKGQMAEWYKQVGEKWPLYIGGKQFGPPLLMLEDVQWSNVKHAPDGTIIYAEAEIYLVEWYKGIELHQGWFKPPKPEEGETGDIFASGISNQEKIWNFLRSQGFSAAATAGVIGNYEAECGCNPDSEEIPNGYGTHGYGLAQWTNTKGSPRRTKLFNWCSKHGKDVRKLETQLEYMMVEYNETFAAYIKAQSGYDYKTITNVYTATDVWLDWFEGIRSRAEVVHWDRRIAAANKFYNMWKNYKIVPHASPIQPIGGAGVTTGSWLWPLPTMPNCGILAYYNNNAGHTHNAGDFGCPVGTRIVAADGGRIDWIQRWDGYTRDPTTNQSYGNMVRIRHSNGWITLYAHMSRHADGLKLGPVARGQTIGYSGATGNVTGPHMHMEIFRDGYGQYQGVFPGNIRWNHK